MNEQEPPEEWVKVYQIMGDSVPTLQDGEMEERLDVVRQLPTLIGMANRLTARYKRSADRISVYVLKTSLDGFSADLRHNLDALCANLADYDRMPRESRWSISVLAMLVIDHCLFPWLVELAGDRKKALSIIRSGWAYYLELDGTGSLSLMRFGIPEGRMETSQVLKDRFTASKRVRRHEIKSALMKIDDPERVEQVANAICLLIRAYEDKDRPSGPR